MAAGTRYFLYNTDAGWSRGVFYHTCCENGGLTAHVSGHRRAFVGAYFSLAHDSMERDTVWHRMSFAFTLPAQCYFQLSYYAANEKSINLHGEAVDLDTFLQSDQLNAVEKQSELETLYTASVRNAGDIPLFSARGRYFWFQIEIFSENFAAPVISRLKIEYPRYTFADYLPQFYTRNAAESDFLIRFLAVFQNVYLATEEKVDRFSQLLSLVSTDDEFVRWLSSWLAVEEPYLWSRDSLRTLVGEAYGLFKLKGTREGLRRIITLFTGKTPLIIENYKVLDIIGGKDYEADYKALYVGGIYAFTVFLAEGAVPDRQQLMALERIVDSFKPAHTQAQIVLLRPDFLLGSHCYLGINSVLPQQLGLSLDGTAALPFQTHIY